jgi:hypothetical protein
MALRLIEITVPDIQQSKVRTALADLDVISVTFQSLGENGSSTFPVESKSLN